MAAIQSQTLTRRRIAQQSLREAHEVGNTVV
jgi:hypothetical protein